MAFILTIDDGPSELAASKLDFLNEQGIQATWFCLGENLDKKPDTALEIIRSGHILANHTYSHPHFSHISFEEGREEIMRTDRIIDQLYAKAGVPRPVKLFRFPYGDQGDGETVKQADKLTYKQQLERLLQQEHFTPIIKSVEFCSYYLNRPGDYDWLWSYDVQEWAIGHDHGLQLGVETVKTNLHHFLNTYDKGRDQVILIHDHERSNPYFPELVSTMQADNNFILPDFTHSSTVGPRN